jgi:hypothetical protein
MQRPTLKIAPRASAHAIRCFLLALVVLPLAQYDSAQNTPLISGGGAFFTSTNGGNTNYYPITEPVLAAPLGQHILVESRASLLESLPPGRFSCFTALDHCGRPLPYSFQHLQ